MPDDHRNSTQLIAPSPTAYTTTDPEQAHQFLRAAYVDNTMRITGSQDGFRMRNVHHDLGAYAMSSLSHTMAVEHVAQPLGYLMIGRLQVGRFECESAGRTLRPAKHDVFLVASPDRPYIARWETMRLQLIRIDLPLLGVVSGAEPNRLRFADTEPRSPAHARHLARTLNYVGDSLLTDSGAMASPLVVAQTGRLLAAAALRTFAHTSGRDEKAGEGVPATPATVRRAIAFIEQHADEDIGGVEIATAVRSTPDALRTGFRRHLDTTPSEFLTRVRLDRVRQALVRLGPVEPPTADAVAARWGFTDPDGFAARYRATYGANPASPLEG